MPLCNDLSCCVWAGTRTGGTKGTDTDRLTESQGFLEEQYSVCAEMSAVCILHCCVLHVDAALHKVR